jgi:translation initiation factor 2 gamma subunit (eIF-2gamma)
MSGPDIVAAVVVATLAGAAIMTAALPLIARRDPVPPVSRRAMSQLEAREDLDADGIR